MTTLKPTLGLWQVTLYGLGTTVGAGIYVLIGKVAGEAGYQTPWSFVVAALLTLLTALSYGELTARLPSSAGQAVYLWQAFRARWPGYLAAALVVAEAVIAGAAILQGSVGYLQEFIGWPGWLLSLLLIGLLTLLALWGISESVGAAALFTLIEVGGLLAVIAVALWHTPDLVERLPLILPTAETGITGIMGGTLIAFFAFIGFETLVNVAEEVAEPRRVMPRAIGLTLLITLLLYVSLAVIAVLAIPLADLVGASAPLARLWQQSGGDAWAISVIGIFATANGALIMLIMGARLLFGLGRDGKLPRLLGQLHPRRRTPIIATLVMGLATAAAGLLLPIDQLAAYSSLVVLLLFCLMNAALLRLKLQKAAAPAGFRVPLWVPILALIANAGFILYELITRLA